jgi:hypothetical protein
VKGFPNQLAKLSKLTSALAVARDLIAKGQNVRNDEVYGNALVRRGVIGPRDKTISVAEYLKTQREKARSGQSHQTTARGLRELFEILGLIADEGEQITLTGESEVLAAQAGNNLTSDLVNTWRGVMQKMAHDGGDGTTSHPYQVLLRLVANRPGITRAKCALALEARDDSDKELQRIVAHSHQGENEIMKAIGVTKVNWDNAKKILPSFGEQLGDLIKIKDRMYLSNAPGEGTAGSTQSGIAEPRAPWNKAKIGKPKTGKKIGATEIAKAGTLDSYDEIDLDDVELPNAATVAATKKKLLERLKRHNNIVRRIAVIFEANKAELYENPFDCLACFSKVGMLTEVKSLDGTDIDERKRVRDALSQLLYYEAFVTEPYADGRQIIKVACFERRISDAHINWLESSDIEVIWLEDDGFVAREDTAKRLQRYMGDGITS